MPDSLHGQHEQGRSLFARAGRRGGLAAAPWTRPLFGRPAPGLVLALAGVLCLGACGLLALGQITPTGPNTQEKEAIANSAEKLRDLHKQGDSGPTWLEIVSTRGFIGELYTTLSRDNTPLALYHLINPLANSATLNKYPVLMFHGVNMDAAHTISHSEFARPRKPLLGNITWDASDTSLPFMLANNNFDVWMCEARGTSLNNHLVSDDFNPIQAQKFWNFSLDEQVHYDLPVMIDFVLEQTNEDKLHYVGFSESTFMMFALLSSHAEYHDKLASFTALAPVAYVAHITGLGLAQFSTSVLVPESINGNFVPRIVEDTTLSSVRALCQVAALTRTMCQAITSGLGGVGDNASSAQFFSNFVKSTSIKAIRQFMQLYAQRRFGMYDYGPAGNLRQYGQPVPPDYLLANVRLPALVLIRGARDFLSTPQDQKRLLAELGVKPYLDLNYPGYNHFDPLIGNHVVEEVNLPVARVMLDWSREWARRAGLPSYLRAPAEGAPEVGAPGATGLTAGPIAAATTTGSDATASATATATAPAVSALSATPALAAPSRRPRAMPVAVSRPDGSSRTLPIKSNLFNDLLNGVLQSTSKKIVNGAGPAGGVFVGAAGPMAGGPLAFVSNVARTVGSLPLVG